MFLLRSKYHLLWALIALGFVLLYNFTLLKILLEPMGVESPTYSFKNLSIVEIISALLLAPIIEEFIFRFHQRGNVNQWGIVPLMFAISGIISLQGYQFLGITFGILAFVSFIMQSQTVKILQEQRRFVVLISTILFAFAHHHVIDSDSTHIDYIASVVIFLVPGLFFSYVRIRYSFYHAIAAHSLNNF